MSFTDYWKEKAQKRRKSWAGKAKRFAERHAQLENIRMEVFLPIDYTAGFDLDDYKVLHYTKKNPIVDWQSGWSFAFSEDNLRQAMGAEGADMSSFKMEVSWFQSLVGKEAPQPKVTGYNPNWTPNKVFDIRDEYHKWLKRMYEICTDVQTCKLTYGQVTMIIRRYATEGIRFAYYEVIPCEQLVRSAMLMEETSFNRLNIATLLMEMAAEYELRQEELNYHAKQLKIRTMEAVTTADVDYKLWDDWKLQEKLKEYVKKDYTLDKVMDQVLRPWKSAIKKYFEAITEREKQNKEDQFDPYGRDGQLYIDRTLRPYFDRVGLQEVKVWLPNEKSSEIYFEYKGFLAKHNSYYRLFYPNAHYCHCNIPMSRITPLCAIADYLKMMPTQGRRTDEMIKKVMWHYNHNMSEKEEYLKVIKTVEPLARQYAGKPIGKLMKYLQWNTGQLMLSSFPLSSLKILNDRAFSYEKKNMQRLDMSQGHPVVITEDVTYERWLDPECHNVFAGDPDTTDVEKWKAEHRRGVVVDTWSLAVQDFLLRFLPPYSKLPLSIDFIEQRI